MQSFVFVSVLIDITITAAVKSIAGTDIVVAVVIAIAIVSGSVFGFAIYESTRVGGCCNCMSRV